MNIGRGVDNAGLGVIAAAHEDGEVVSAAPAGEVVKGAAVVSPAAVPSPDSLEEHAVLPDSFSSSSSLPLPPPEAESPLGSASSSDTLPEPPGIPSNAIHCTAGSSL